MLDPPPAPAGHGRTSPWGSSAQAAPARRTRPSRARAARRLDRRHRWAGPRLRRWLSAMLAALAVGVLAHLVTSPPVADGVPAVVAVREVAVGTELAAGLVAVRQVPRSALPDGALRDVEEALGRPASSVLAPGEVLTRHDVRTADLVTGLGAGTVAVWVPVGEAAVTAALAGGDRIDLRSPADGAVLARGVMVLAVGSGEQGGAWVAVDDEEAGALATQRADPLGGGIQVALRGP